MTHPTERPKTVTYHDFWVKIIGSLIASELIDALGRNGSILERITTRSFFVDLAAGFFISLLLWEWIRFVIKKLDQRMDWFAQPVLRISLQLLFGVVVPAFLSFVFTMFFMQVAYQQDIFQTSWLHSEFYVVILIIVMINLVYFTWWLFLKNKSDQQKSHPAFHITAINKQCKFYSQHPSRSRKAIRIFCSSPPRLLMRY
jgi:hypothetical protein